jgi:predicted transcriptional regulator YdeE
MEMIEVSGFQVSGIETTTTNQDKMNPATANIANLWNKMQGENVIRV